MNALAAIVFALRGLDPAQFGPSALHNHRKMSLNQIWRHRRIVNGIRDRGAAANTTLDELVNKEMAKSGSFEIKVFSTNREYLDEIAWKSDPTGNWEARAWTDCSYVYVFNDIVAARRFFYAVRHHAEAETAIDVIF